MPNWYALRKCLLKPKIVYDVVIKYAPQQTQMSWWQQQIERVSANDPTLKELDLRNNKIGVEGSKALSEALQHNTITCC